MPRLETYKCDMCPSIKKDENGWFRAKHTEDGIFMVMRWENSFTNLEDPECDDPYFSSRHEEKYLCSESCVVKLMSQAIGYGTYQSTEESVS